MILLYSALAVLAGGVINYGRGGNLKGRVLPESVSSRTIATILMGLLAGLWTWSIWIGLAFAATFLFWAAISAWGLWITLGRGGDENPDQPMDDVSGIERVIRKVAPSPHLALLIRFAFASPPLVAMGWAFGKPALFIAAGVLPFALVAAYELAWRLWERGIRLSFNRKHAIGEAEFLAGLAWGAVVVTAL